MSGVDIIPGMGERVLICGQTGSGKTAFACWLLREIEPTPFVIYDTKLEPKFDALPNSKRVHTLDQAAEALDDIGIDYVIMTPPEAIMGDKKALDGLLYHHYRHWQGVGAYIDEVTSFNDNARADPGLLNMLSRGRSKGITCVMSTQRPAWLSRYCLTESQRFYMFAVTDSNDLKRFDAFLENYSKKPRLTVGEHKFYYKEIGKPGEPALFNPVPIDENSHSGYVDQVASTIPEGELGHSEPEAGASNSRGLVWL
jgi:hypothetical protein